MRGFRARTANGIAAALGFTAACALAGTAAAQRAWKTPGEADAATARQLASSGRCEAALALFDSAIEARSGDAALRRDRGLCHERLAHPAPAIDDYRAYLSMQPTAPDAGPIRARLDALEQSEPEVTPLPGGAGDGAGEDVPDARRRSARGLPEAGDWFVAFHLAERAWSDNGYTVPTVAYGAAAGYTYAAPLELEARFVLLHTNFRHTSGYGFALDNTFKFGLGTIRRWEVGIALGGGVEGQSDELGVSRKFVFGNANPKLRFLVSGPIALEAAPEVGVGLMDQEGATATTLFYGGYIRLSWLIRAD